MSITTELARAAQDAITASEAVTFDQPASEALRLIQAAEDHLAAARRQIQETRP